MMMKIKYLFVVLLLVTPVFADVDLNANCGGGTYSPNDNERIYLSGNLTCDIYKSNPTAATQENVTIDFQGYTLNGSVVFGDPNVIGGAGIFQLDVGNGKMTGIIMIDGGANRVYIHDLYSKSILIGSSQGTEYDLARNIQIERVDVTSTDLSGYTGSTVPDAALNTWGDLYVKDSVFHCSGGEFQAGYGLGGGTGMGMQTFEEVINDNCTTPSYNYPYILYTVTTRNSTFPIAVQNGMTVIDEQPLTVTLKDQNNNNINGMASIRKTSGGNIAQFDWNPTPDEIIGVDEGIGRTYLAKNITTKLFASSEQFSSYPTYNVTAKSRGKSQSKMVTFNSPANETFDFDFTSEDEITNTVVVDNRTSTEKAGNGLMSIFPVMLGIVGIIIAAAMVI